MKKIVIFVLLVNLTFLNCCIDKKIENDYSYLEVYKNMFERINPSYYNANSPLIENSHIVYINFDGFAWYYFEEAKKRNLIPNLLSFMEDGITFNDLRNTLPSITNSCQNQILSGATSKVTENVYRYYDKTTNLVIQQNRENASPTIITEAIDKGYSIIDVCHYLGEKDLTKDTIDKLYIEADSNIVNTQGYSDYFARFSQLIKVVSGTTLYSFSNRFKIEDLPQILILYCDDLDAIGHNTDDNYGYAKATTESQRMDNVLQQLNLMDLELGNFINACKEKGVYDDMTFFLTTDHGMTPFGNEDYDTNMDYGQSKLDELKTALKKIDKNYELQLVKAGESPSTKTSIVGVGANLNIQLTFLNDITDAQLDKIKKTLLNESYIGAILTKKDLEKLGYWQGANVDLLISPKSRYFFSGNSSVDYYVRGQHDSLEEESNHIYGVIWGKGIKQGYVYDNTAYNIDFGVTMAACLGMNLAQANGIVLDIFANE